MLCPHHNARQKRRVKRAQSLARLLLEQRRFSWALIGGVHCRGPWLDPWKVLRTHRKVLRAQRGRALPIPCERAKLGGWEAARSRRLGRVHMIRGSSAHDAAFANRERARLVVPMLSDYEYASLSLTFHLAR